LKLKKINRNQRKNEKKVPNQNKVQKTLYLISEEINQVRFKNSKQTK
jgi:hypothetical protein